jgi:hypothetical protein
MSDLAIILALGTFVVGTDAFVLGVSFSGLLGAARLRALHNAGLGGGPLAWLAAVFAAAGLGRASWRRVGPRPSGSERPP